MTEPDFKPVPVQATVTLRVPASLSPRALKCLVTQLESELYSSLVEGQAMRGWVGDSPNWEQAYVYDVELSLPKKVRK